MTDRQQPEEYIVTADELQKLMSWSTHRSPGVCQYERRLEILKRVQSRPNTHSSATEPAPTTLEELKITSSMLYEFCEWFCDYDCEEKPCVVTVSRLHERLEGIEKQMQAHPEYLAKWEIKRSEQRSLRSGGK